jgi:hypothetical protein
MRCLKEYPMKTLAALFLCALLCSGCAAFEEAYYVDREFGQATQASWDRQIANPNYRHAGKATEGFDVMESEAAMQTRFRTLMDPSWSPRHVDDTPCN